MLKDVTKDSNKDVNQVVPESRYDMFVTEFPT